MITFQDEYVRQVVSNLRKIHDKLFPHRSMEEFEQAAQADITAGRNLCSCGTKTMERIYPVGPHLANGWICSQHAQAMWSKGLLHGSVVFNMTKEAP